MNTLAELSQLEPNWDGEGAKPITEKALATAWIMLNSPAQPVPTSSGGIQLEWHEGGMDIEISIEPDGTIEEWAEPA